jgi:hypothetical protein
LHFALLTRKYASTFLFAFLVPFRWV